MTIGLFTALPTTSVPTGDDVIRTTGYMTVGKGAGFYKRVATEPTALPASAYSADADDNWWALVEEAPNAYQFGAAGDGSTDDAAAINDGLLYAANATYGGGVLYLLAAEYKVCAQILHPNFVCLYGWPGAKILRNWTSTNGNKYASATIRATDAIDYAAYRVTAPPYYLVVEDGQYADSCRLGGSLYIGMTVCAREEADGDPSMRMCCAYYNGCDRLVIDDGVTLERGGRDWCLVLHGNDIRVGSVNIIGGANVYEDGIHVMGGRNGSIIGAHVQAGDDALAFGSNYNQPISGWIAMGCQLNSNAAHCIRFIQDRTGFDEPPLIDQEIESILISGCTGQGGVIANGVIRVDDPAMMISARILDMDLTHSTAEVHTGDNRDAIRLIGGNVTITGILRSPVRSALNASAGTTGTVDIVSDDAGQVSGYPAVLLTSVGEMVVDGRYQAYDFQGVKILNCSDVIRSRFLDVYNIGNGCSGVDVVGSSAGYDAGHLKVTAEAGATSARGVGGVGGSVLRIGGFSPRGVRPFGNPTTPASIAAAFLPGEFRSAYVAFGATTTYGDGVLKLLGEGDATDDLLNITNGYVGQRLTVMNGMADPTTTTITIKSTGNIAVASNRVLNAGWSQVELLWNGSSWIETAFWV